MPELVEHLSRTVELFPGDVLFTGTPAGVGVGIGELVQTFTFCDQAIVSE